MTDHSSDANPDSTRVLKCSGTADFLAALPQLAGFTATHSIFVLFFEGSRTREAMRVDLPPDDDPREAADLLEFLSHTIRSFSVNSGRTAAPAIAIMSEQTFADCDGPPWLRLARRIERRLRRDRIYPRELCVRAPDGWVSYLDQAAPRSGRSLDEIERSPIAVAARMARQLVPTLAELGALPPIDPDRVARATSELATLDRSALVASQRAGQREGQDAGQAPDLGPVVSARSRVALAPVAARELQDVRSDLSPEAAGRIAHVASDVQGWWHLAMGMITRPEFPGELERDLGERVLSELPVTNANLAARGDLFGAAPGAAGGPSISMAGILAAICPEFTERERLSPVRGRLARTLADLPTVARPGVFALSALVWWLCGSQTTANAHVDAALEIRPEHEVSLMVRGLIAVPVIARQLLVPAAPGSSSPLSPPRAAAS